jgi:hypothetical protein
MTLTPEELAILPDDLRRAYEALPTAEQITAKQAFERYGVDYKTLKRWDKTGVISSIMVDGVTFYPAHEITAAITEGADK